jgi:hypothetical protein
MGRRGRGRGAYRTRCLFVVIVIFLLTRIINVTILSPSSAKRFSGFFIKRLVDFFVVELGLAVDQIAHAHFCDGSEERELGKGAQRALVHLCKSWECDEVHRFAGKVDCLKFNSLQVYQPEYLRYRLFLTCRRQGWQSR